MQCGYPPCYNASEWGVSWVYALLRGGFIRDVVAVLIITAHLQHPCAFRF